MIKVYKSYLSPTPTFHPPCHFSVTRTTHTTKSLPSTTHAIQQTRKINVNRKNNGLTTAELHHRCFPWFGKHLRFWEFVLDGGFESLYSKDISKDKKHFWTWQYSQKYCHNWCHFDVFIIIFRHTAWLEDSGAVALRASLKNLLKFTGKNLCRVLFFNKVTGWKPASSSNRESGTGVFLWVLRNS